MLIGFIAIIAGILLGTLVSQFVSAIVLQTFGEEYQFIFTIFPDTSLCTFLFFGAVFLLNGAKNIVTIRRLKIIDMLHNSQNNVEVFSLRKQLSKWIIGSATVSLIIAYMLIAALLETGDMLGKFYIVFVGIASLSIIIVVVSVFFFVTTKKGTSGSVIVFLLTIFSAVTGIRLLSLNVST